MPKKKKKRKRPLGWRPGSTPEFEPHPSVVRYNELDVKTHIGMGYLDGHTHARFVANPKCCELCAKWSGKVQRIATVLNWKYATAHPNCIDYWETGYMVGGKFSVDKAESSIVPFNTPRRFHIVKARPGLVLKETRPGVRRWVREEVQAPKFPAKRGKGATKKLDRERKKEAAIAGKKSEDVEPEHAAAKKKLESAGYTVEKKEDTKGPKLDKKTVTVLKKHQKEIEQLKSGESKSIQGVPVVKIDDDFNGVTIHGKRLVVVGASAAAALVHYATTLGATAGAATTGDFQGSSMSHAQEIGKDVQTATKAGVQKAADKVQEAADKAAKKKEQGDGKLSKKVDKKRKK